MYLNVFNAVWREGWRVGRVDRMVDEIGAGVPRMRCLNGPNVDVDE
jgi:hypothetical protein